MQPPDIGSRNDPRIVRSVSVEVGSALARLVVLRRDGGEAGEVIGGSVRIGLELDLQNQTVLSQKATLCLSEELGANVGFTRLTNEKGIEMEIDFTRKDGWHKWDAAQEKWALADTPPTSDGRWRWLYEWNTAGPPLHVGQNKLWNHNGEHKLAFVQVDGQAGNTLRISEANVEVKPRRHRVANLVIQDVSTNGNEDYFIFDPASDDPDRTQPSIKFRLRDEGDRNTYRWFVYIEPTSQTQSYAAYAWMEGTTTSVDQVVSATWNGRAGDGSSDQPLLPRGTYTFDVVVHEVDPHVMDEWGRPSLVDMAVLKSGKLVMSHHTMEWVTQGDDDDDAATLARISYRLDDGQNRDVSQIGLVFLDHDFAVKATYDGAGQLHHGRKDKHLYQDIDVYTLGETDGEGVWRGVFWTVDAHASQYRDHKNKRMWAVNQTRPHWKLHVMIDPGHGRYLNDNGVLSWRRPGIWSEWPDTSTKPAEEWRMFHEDDSNLALARVLRLRLSDTQQKKWNYDVQMIRYDVNEDAFAKVRITATVRNAQPGDIVTFEVTDPDDASPHPEDTTPDVTYDFTDGALTGGLTIATSVDNDQPNNGNDNRDALKNGRDYVKFQGACLPIRTVTIGDSQHTNRVPGEDDVWTAWVVLHITNRFGGDNYVVNVTAENVQHDKSFSEQDVLKKKFKNSGILVAWKRVHSDFNRSYVYGSFLTRKFPLSEDPNSDIAEKRVVQEVLNAGEDYDVLFVRDTDDFNIGDDLIVWNNQISEPTVEVSLIRKDESRNVLIVSRVPRNQIPFPPPLTQTFEQTFPIYSGVRIKGKDDKLDEVLRDALPRTYGDNTDGSDGGTFVEFWETGLSHVLPHVKVFQNLYEPRSFLYFWSRSPRGWNQFYMSFCRSGGTDFWGIAHPYSEGRGPRDGILAYGTSITTLYSGSGTANPLTQNQRKNVMAHEFGHLLGRLGDNHIDYDP